MYKGSIKMETPMLYAMAFIGLFTIGGLTGLFLAALGLDIHIHDTYFVIAHFHYVMVGGMVTAYLGGLHFWWPKMTGRMYPEAPAKLAALITFIGFNLTFFPQFILGYMGMPRRYWAYPPEFQVLNVLSTAGASILSVGFILPLIYFIWSLKYGEIAGDNPWEATGLEWETSSPPPTHNFHEIPIVTKDPYAYGEDAGGSRCPLARQPPPIIIRRWRTSLTAWQQQQDASTFGMWVFLLTEIMMFGGLFTAYLIYRIKYYDAFVAGSTSISVSWGFANTLVLIGSSLHHGHGRVGGAKRLPQAADCVPDPDHDSGRGLSWRKSQGI